MQTNAINGRIGQKVAELRKVHGWSQAELADCFGKELGRSIDATTVTRLEQGRRPIAVHELIALSAVLGVSAVDLMPVTSELDDRVQAARVRSDMAQARLEAAEREAHAAAEYFVALIGGANATEPPAPATAGEMSDQPRAEPNRPVEYRGDPVTVDGVPTYRVWSSDAEVQDNPVEASSEVRFSGER